MHLSLCDQMAEFVNLCPLGPRPEKWSINYKTIDGVLKWPANVSNKNEIMPAVFGQTFLFVSPRSRHLRWQKTVFFAFDFDFFGGEGSGSLRYIETYPALNLVWVLIAGRIWIFTGKQLRQLKKRTAVRTLLATKR